VYLKARLEAGGSNVALEWGDRQGPHPCYYSVGSASLRADADRIRTLLESLALWSQLADAKELRSLLFNLAEEGQKLRFDIFDTTTRTAQEIVELQEWIADRIAAGDIELAVTVDPSLSIPWGFVFDGNPSALLGQAQSTAAEYDQFWILKLKLSMVFSEAGRPSKTARPRSSYKLLSIVNSEVFADIRVAAPKNYEDLNEIINLSVGPAFNLEHCKTLVAQAAKNDTLIHFFGHCTGGKLDLGADKIDTTKFKMLINDLLDKSDNRPRPYNLIFLNACDTLAGELDASFRSAAAKPGLCGIIATEASVPRLFAAEFGVRFLKSMLIDGNSLGDTMEALRRDPALWPLNLLYSCYASTDYRIVN
jgi:hypothetical protein